MTEPAIQPRPWHERPILRWSFLIVVGLVMTITIVSSIWRLPTNAMGHFNRGISDTERGRYDDAIDNLTRAIELEPQDEEYRYSRGYARSLQGDHVGAMADYEEAVRLAPSAPHPYIYRGFGKRMLRRFEEAVEDYSRAIEINPTIANAYAGRGSALDSLGDEAEALLDFNRAVQREPNNGAYHLKQATLHYDRGDWQQALYGFRRCFETVETEREMNQARLLAWACRRRLGDPDGAGEELSHYLDRRRKLGGVNDWFAKLGRFLVGELDEGDIMKAAMGSREVSPGSFQLSPGDAGTRNEPSVHRSEAFFYAGVVRAIDGDIAGAIGRFRDCLENGNDDHYSYRRAEAELENSILGFRTRSSLADDGSLEVTAVRENGPAAGAGILRGDRLISLDDRPAAPERLDAILDTAEPGRSIAIRLRREGAEREFELTACR